VPIKKKKEKDNRVRNAAIGVAGVGALAGGAYLLSKKKGSIKVPSRATLAAATPPVKIAKAPSVKPKLKKKATSSAAKTEKYKGNFLTRLNEGTDGLSSKEGFLSKKRPGKSKEVMSVRKLDDNNTGFLSKLSVDKKSKNRASTKGMKRADKTRVVELRKTRLVGYQDSIPTIGKNVKATNSTKDTVQKTLNRRLRKEQGSKLKNDASKLAGNRLYFSRYK